MWRAVQKSVPLLAHLTCAFNMPPAHFQGEKAMVEPTNEGAYQFKTWLNEIYDPVWKIRTFLWPKILIIKFKTFYDFL